MMSDLFVNRVSSFFALDVFLSALTLLSFVAIQKFRRKDFPWWMPVAATLLLGVSAGLPLTLYLLERSKITPAESLR